MTTSRVTALIAALGLLLVAAPARAAIDDDTFERMGGTYAVDCAKEGGARVIVGRDEIVVIDGAKKTTARTLETAASWYGENHSDEYRVALLTRVNDDPSLLFAVYEDAKGYYGMLDGDLAHVPGVRPALLNLKFRQCKPEAKAVAKAEAKAPGQPTVTKTVKPAAEARPEPAASAGEAVAALRADRNFRAAYAKAMGMNMRERWIAVLDGPTTPLRTVSLDGQDYVLLAACKAHDCADNNLVVAWAAKRKALIGLIHVAGEDAFVGRPSVAAAEGLKKAWHEEWRGETGGTTP